MLNGPHTMYRSVTNFVLKTLLKVKYDNIIYNKNHNTGAIQYMAFYDVMLFKIFDWTMASIIAFDWL